MDWNYLMWAIIATAFVLIIGGYYWKLKNEITEFVEAIKQGIEDGTVNDIEMARIIKEGKDVGYALKDITFSIVQLLNRR